jgi:zinc transport system substrate-binding protein
MNMKKFLLYITTLLALAGCGQKTSKAPSGLPVITVSIEPQKYFAEALAHDFFTVQSMVPKGSNPETYDPTPKQLVELSKSSAYLRIGYIGFELSWMDRLAASAPHLEFYETSQHVNLILLPGEVKAINHDLSAVEPHLWCSTESAKSIAENTLHILLTLDKKHDKVYFTRYDSLMRHIATVDTLIRRQLSRPGADKAFAIYHPSLSYFARDYGLEQIAIEHDGKEPSPAELETIIDRCRHEHVHLIFVQPEFDHHNADIIARQIGARVVSINPLNEQWDKELIAIAQAIGSTAHKQVKR